MQELFHRFDSQRKGKLAGYQFRKVIEGLGVKLEDWEFAVMLKRFDGHGFKFMKEQVGHAMKSEAAAATAAAAGGKSASSGGSSPKKQSRPMEPTAS